MQKGIFIPTILSFALSVFFLTVPVTPSYAATCSSPDGEPGAMIFNQAHDVFQGCTPDGWIAFHDAGAAMPVLPAGCPNIGDTCSDGTVYAGEHNGIKLYITADNAPDLLEWGPTANTSGMGFCVAPFASPTCETGRENTQFLKDSATIFPAAEYCADATTHGYSDWYLPSRAELNTIYQNIKHGQPDGTHNFQNANYWTSSEQNANTGWMQVFTDGVFWLHSKVNATRVRCVRRHDGGGAPAPVMGTITAPAEVFANAAYVMSWTGTNVANYKIRGDVAASGVATTDVDLGTAVSQPITPTAAGTYTYTITATNAGGASVTATKSVVVEADPTFAGFTVNGGATANVALSANLTFAGSGFSAGATLQGRNSGNTADAALPATAAAIAGTTTYYAAATKTLNSVTRYSAVRSVSVTAVSCSTIGDTCADGTIYAGLSPDGNVPIYAMPTDGPAGGHTVAPVGGYDWNDGSSNWVDTAMENCTSTSSPAASCNTGRTNTAFLAALAGGSPAPYIAAQYCQSLTSNGHSDWYLPAQNELALLYNLYVAGKGGLTSDYYWSSSEEDDEGAWSREFSTGTQHNFNKAYGFRARCVRHGGAQDDTPDNFAFTDVTDQAVNTVITSNTVTINGIGPAAVAVSVTGAGSPLISINGGGWTTYGTISTGQTLRVRLASANTTTTLRSATVTVGTVSDQWDVTTNANSCPNIGDTCSDGTIYAGLSPDGNVPMYAMPTDGPAGGYLIAYGGYNWDDGGPYGDTALENCDWAATTAGCNTGRANTTLLAGLNGVAAQYCEYLTSNGYNDWYLPARNELSLLYDLYVAGKGGFVADYYWSSSESSEENAWYQLFSNGTQTAFYKHNGFRARCVRR